MESRIQRTLRQWFPDVFKEIDSEKPLTDYEILHQFSDFTLHLIASKDERMKEPFKIINILYLNGSLYDRNAIENEFLRNLSTIESPGSLKEHLLLMPENLKSIYLKTILEN